MIVCFKCPRQQAVANLPPVAARIDVDWLSEKLLSQDALVYLFKEVGQPIANKRFTQLGLDECLVLLLLFAGEATDVWAEFAKRQNTETFTHKPDGLLEASGTRLDWHYHCFYITNFYKRSSSTDINELIVEYLDALRFRRVSTTQHEGESAVSLCILDGASAQTQPYLLSGCASVPWGFAGVGVTAN